MQNLCNRIKIKASSRLCRQINHDIMSPVATLGTVIPELKLEVQDKELIEILELSVERIKEIVARKSVTKAYYLKNIVGELVKEKRYEYPNIEIIYKNNLTQKTLVQCNKGDFKRAFSNIINNAVESYKVSEKIIILIQLNQLGESATLDISDYGEGIPNEQLEKVQEYDFTTKESGSGLGLSFARDIVKKYNWKMDIDSQVGFGTTIRVEFN